MAIELGREYKTRTGERREVVGLSGDMVLYVMVPRAKLSQGALSATAAEFIRWADAGGAIDPAAGETSDAQPTPDEVDMRADSSSSIR